MDGEKDIDWLAELGNEQAVIVPTRGLLSHLNEQFAVLQVAQGNTVWQPPKLFVWSDFLNLIWQRNRQSLSAANGVFKLISAQQSLLLWTQVVEKSRRQEQALTLLNVQQTVTAVQRSWRLLHDWQVSKAALADDHVADTEQFLSWTEEYQALLHKRGLVDEPSLLSMVLNLEKIDFPFTHMQWREYDLITAAQQAFNQRAVSAGVEVDVRMREIDNQPSTEYLVYAEASEEIRHSLRRARQLIEQDPAHTVSIVVPDLSLRLPQVRELAREVFQPAASPMDVQQNDNVYRFSLGEPLSDWAAIETALSLIKLLQNRVSVVDFSFLLRNRFLSQCVNNASQALNFDSWLKQQRLHTLTVDKLASLYEQCLLDKSSSRNKPQSNTAGQNHDLDKSQDPLWRVLQNIVTIRQQLKLQLRQATANNQFAALPFDVWLGIYDQWLQAWGWRTNSTEYERNSVQHQLDQRWQKLLLEYASLSVVQRQAGLKRAFDVLQQMTRDAMFLPKAANSPILISSHLEAIGRPVDTCFLTGMSDAYPAPPRIDAFIPTRLLAGTDNPNASAQASFEQAGRVNQSVLSQANTCVVSYALIAGQSRDVTSQPSPLYRHSEFLSVSSESKNIGQLELERYQDIYGPAWQEAGRARGGSRIFENQSNCAFKAFVNHQLDFDQSDEAEFGLDAMDRGNVVHYLLYLLWEQLDSQATLLSKSEAELRVIIDQVIVQTLDYFAGKLTDEKMALLNHEKLRFRRLLGRWLEFETRRPENFTVLEREEENFTEFAGIKFKLVIDRLDITDDGRTFVVDYKTGAANRNDWLGDRLSRPQLPLYAVALDAQKRKQVSGIAIAKVDAVEPKFIELAEAEVFRKGKGYEEQWLDSRPQWEAIFADLAEQFLSGFAEVNPIEEKTCQYCDLHAVCRVSQLRAETSVVTEQSNNGGAV